MRGRLLTGISVAMLCLSAQGTPPVSMKVSALVDGVQRGTHLTAEMRADYVLLDLTPGSGKPGQPSEVLRMKGVGVLRIDVTVPASGKARPKTTAEILFDKPLSPAPAGMAAIMEFPIHYSLTCGPSSPDCGARTRDSTFAMKVPPDPAQSFSPCLQFRRGMNASDVLVAIGPDCEDPRKNNPTIVKQ